MNIQRTPVSTAMAPKQSKPESKQEPKNLVLQAEEFVTSPSGAAITYGVGGAVPGLGVYTNIVQGNELEYGATKDSAPNVANGLRVASYLGAAANGIATFGFLMEAMEPGMSPTLSTLKTAAFAASGLIGAASAYSLASFGEA